MRKMWLVVSLPALPGKSISKGRGQVKCGSAGTEAYSKFLRVDAGDSLQ